ncbi:MAG: DNA repair protein RecN [Erysipelotrichaceae bacterium]
MLQRLYIKNFVLIDELHLDFSSGMSVFTGETGAGKSITMDALSLLMGERFQSYYAKDETASTIVEAVFTSKHPDVLAVFQESGIEFSEELIVAREFKPDGKSRNTLNHRSVTLSFLKETIGLLIDIHSQHQTQYLLQKKYHLSLLDHYCQHVEKLTQLKAAYQTWTQAQQALVSFHDHTNQNDLDYLGFQCQEILDLNYTKERFEETQARILAMSSFEKNKQALSQATSALVGDNGASTTLYEAARALQSVKEETCVPLYDRLMDLYYQLEDISSELQSIDDSLYFDEEQLEKDQNYVFQVQRVLRKYHNSERVMMETLEEYQTIISQQENREVLLQQLQQDVDLSFAAYETLAQQVHLVRVDAAKQLEAAIQSQLQDLHLPHAKFSIRITEKNSSATGNDQIEFFVSMNQNQSLQPLKDVASGGELSRLMLGLKVVFTNLQGIETIVFDEIDSGVSGKVAFAIGQKMRELARVCQVFTITHLAAVAASADTHFLVEKLQKEQDTITQIHALSENDTIAALAQMNTHVSSIHALESAKELRIQARKDK